MSQERLNENFDDALDLLGEAQDCNHGPNGEKIDTPPELNIKYAECWKKLEKYEKMAEFA